MIVRLKPKRPVVTVHMKWCRRWPGLSTATWITVAEEIKAKRIRSNDWARIQPIVEKHK